MSNICSNCGGGGCQQCNCGYIVALPESVESQLTFQNVNLTGIGVLDGQSGSAVNFRGVASANVFMTVTLDAGNHVALFTIDINALAAALPAATTTQPGVLETATDAEAIAKAVTDKIVTPSNFAAMAASATFAGFVELATNAEAITGTSILLALTPANLTAVLATKGTTVTFADAPTRVAAVPAFKGQFGYQLDALSAWVAASTTAGDWQQIFSNGTTYSVDQANTVQINTASQLQFSQADAISTVGIDFNTMGVQFTNAMVTFSNTLMNFASATPQVGGVSMGASQVFTTDGGGQVNNRALNTFISSANTQTGWAVTNPSVSRTLDVAAATLGDLRAVVGTLINDFKAIKLPAT